MRILAWISTDNHLPKQDVDSPPSQSCFELG